MYITRSHLHAIDFANRHGISLVPGRKIYGDGNCALNYRCCYAEKFLEPVLVYRSMWVTALQEEQRMMEWDLLNVKNNSAMPDNPLVFNTKGGQDIGGAVTFF